MPTDPHRPSGRPAFLQQLAIGGLRSCRSVQRFIWIDVPCAGAGYAGEPSFGRRRAGTHGRVPCNSAAQYAVAPEGPTVLKSTGASCRGECLQAALPHDPRTLWDQLATKATIKRLRVSPTDDIRITGTRVSKSNSGFALAVSRRWIRPTLVCIVIVTLR